VLIDELGTEPGGHLQDLHQRILARDPALLPAPPAPAAQVAPPYSPPIAARPPGTSLVPEPGVAAGVGEPVPWQALGVPAAQLPWCLSDFLSRRGHWQAYADTHDTALAAAQRLDDPDALARTRAELGFAYGLLGSYASAHTHLEHALDYYQQALRLFSDLGDRYKETETLSSLGDTHHAGGDTAAARECWQRALAILADLGHPDAGTVRAKLGQIPS
jgi:tetratricopeptide (TPR) repeat protein